jgi:hypothetical protein
MQTEKLVTENEQTLDAGEQYELTAEEQAELEMLRERNEESVPLGLDVIMATSNKCSWTLDQIQTEHVDGGVLTVLFTEWKNEKRPSYTVRVSHLDGTFVIRKRCGSRIPKLDEPLIGGYPMKYTIIEHDELTDSYPIAFLRQELIMINVFGYPSER